MRKMIYVILSFLLLTVIHTAVVDAETTGEILLDGDMTLNKQLTS